MIQAYFTQIKTVVDEHAVTDFVSETGVRFETRGGGQGYLKGTVAFGDGSVLHFSEYLDQTGNTAEKVMYTYHYQDAAKQMIFRYDNSQHRPLLPHPDHKVLPCQNCCLLHMTYQYQKRHMVFPEKIFGIFYRLFLLSMFCP